MTEKDYEFIKHLQERVKKLEEENKKAQERIEELEDELDEAKRRGGLHVDPRSA